MLKTDVPNGKYVLYSLKQTNIPLTTQDIIRKDATTSPSVGGT